MCCKLKLTKRNLATFKRWVDSLSVFYGSFRIFMKVAGPIMFIAANILAFTVIVILLFKMTPKLMDTSVLLYAINVVFILWGSVNIYFNYWMCAFTPPGTPPICHDPSLVLGMEEYKEDNQKLSRPRYNLQIELGVYYKYCHKCHCIKPPRAHHCSVSEKCVLNMDHYCPWMRNCVGYYNYRYFVLFLFYMTLGALYVVIYTLFDVVSMTPEERVHIKMSAVFRSNIFSNLRSSTLSASMYAFSLALSAVVSAGALLMWHSYLIYTNQTTIDFYVNHSKRYALAKRGIEYKNPFDQGLYKNIHRVFGNVPLYIHLFPNFTQPAPPMYPFEYYGQACSDEDMCIV